MSATPGRVRLVFGIRRPHRGTSASSTAAAGVHARRPGAHRDRRRAGGSFPVTGAGVAALAVFICCLTADPSAMADEVSPVVAAPTAPSNPGLDTSQNQRHGLNMPASALKHRPKVTAVKPVKVIAKAQAHNLSAVRASRAGRRGTKTYNLVYAANYTRLAMGWSSKEFGCLNKLWTGESNWRPMAKNRRSGAYGIPQALPGHKMRVEGKDWKTNPNTQIRWGAKYIKVKYQTPCKALRYKHSRGWY